MDIENFIPLWVLDANKRLFWLYLLTAICIGLLIAPRQLFKRSHWMTKSSFIDSLWLFINHWIYSFCIVPFLGATITLALAVNGHLVTWFGTGDFFNTSPFWLGLFLAFSLFLLQDFSKYCLHFAYHKWSFLWRFHAVHHSAANLTPLTLHRIHPVEMLLNTLRSLLVSGLATGIFLYLFKSKLSVESILGVNVFVFFFNVAGSNLRHSHVWFAWGKLENWFISPAQHQIHHSNHKDHFDRNFGSALAIWDRLFGSLLFSKNQHVKQFGINADQKMYWFGHGKS